MTFKYSICHPDKADIEYRNQPLSDVEVMNIAENYPWEEKLKLSESLNEIDVHYSPSLDFTCIENGKSFCLTTMFDKHMRVEFSLWYNRPKQVKVMMGLFGKKEKMVVDDAWGFNFHQALKYLKYFVEGNYPPIEELY